MGVFVAVLGGVFSMGALATDLFQPALPAVAAGLGIGTSSAQLTVTAVLLGLGLGQLVAGPLSDSLGRRLPLLAGLALFVAASLVCAVAPSAGFLIAARLAQGIAAAVGIPLAGAVVTDHFRDREAARVLSRLVMVSFVVPVLAPLAGSLVLSIASWRGLFLVMAAFGASLFAAVWFGLRESLPRERRAATSFRLIAGDLSRVGRDGGFVGLTLAAGLMYGAFFAYLTGASFVVQEEYGASPLFFSVLFSINAVGMMAASHLNHMLLAHVAPRTLFGAALIGCAVAGVGALAATLVPSLGLVALEAAFFLLTFCVGLATPDATALALSRHPEAAGSAAAGFGVGRLGIASLTTPFVGLGGGIAALPMAGVMIATSAGGAAALAAIWRRVGGAAPAPSAPLATGEAADDVAVG